MSTDSFIARWPGRCDVCDGHIRPGNLILYNSFSQIIHADCDDAPAERAAVICPTCHLTKPCDCEARR